MRSRTAIASRSRSLTAPQLADRTSSTSYSDSRLPDADRRRVPPRCDAWRVAALSEGMQAIITAGDIRQDPRTRYPLSYASLFEIIGDGVNPPRQEFVNPPDHNRIVQLRRFHAFSHESAPAIITRLYYTPSATNYIPTTALKQGTR